MSLSETGRNWSGDADPCPGYPTATARPTHRHRECSSTAVGVDPVQRDDGESSSWEPEVIRTTGRRGIGGFGRDLADELDSGQAGHVLVDESDVIGRFVSEVLASYRPRR
jgi:hypothetical protein